MEMTRAERTLHRRAIAAASIGNAFEWYDFTIYVLFAPYIAANFFPSDDPAVELIQAFIVFGVGFIARPVGAVVLGRFADTAGRKAALTLTFALMALGTGAIAFAPTYAVIGAAAPAIILLGRITQGFSAGGEIGGAATVLVENAPEEKRGRAAAWLQASMAFSNIIGAVMGLLVHALLTQAQIGDWGWRLPFVFGLLIVPLGIWLRFTLRESNDFEEVKQTGATSTSLWQVFSEWLGLLRGFGISLIWGVVIYALVIFMPVHVQQSLGMTGEAAFTASIIGNVVLASSCFVSGSMADALGHRRQMTITICAILVGAPAMMLLLVTHPVFPVLVLVQATFCALAGLFSGAAPAVLANQFPARVRASGISISYNSAVTIFAGFAPAIITWLSSRTFGSFAPAIYTSAAAAVALLAVASLPGQRKQTPSLARSST